MTPVSGAARSRVSALLAGAGLLAVAIAAAIALPATPAGASGTNRAAPLRGQLLVFAARLNRSKYESIVLTNRNGRLIRRITTPRVEGDAADPDLADNGRLIVYAATPRRERDGCCNDLYTEGPNRNSSRKRLTRTPNIDEQSPELGRRGRITFISINESSGINKLEVMNNRGTDRRTIISARTLAGEAFDHSVAFGGSQEVNASLSPDGSRVAFYGQSADNPADFESPSDNGIHVIDVDGSDLRRIVTFGGSHEGVYDIDWSPSNNNIAYAPEAGVDGFEPEPGQTPDHLFLVRPDGSEIRDVSGQFRGKDVHTFTFSPSGKVMAVRRGGRRGYKVNLLDLSRTPLRLIGPPPDGHWDSGGSETGAIDWGTIRSRR